MAACGTDTTSREDAPVSDTHDHDKTTFVRVPDAAKDAPETDADTAGAHDQTFMMKPSARAREAAAALSAEREAKRSQTLPPPPPERGPSLDSVDFDVTAGFGDEAPAEADEFFDITQGADSPAAAADVIDPTREPAPAAAPASAPSPAPTSAPAPPVDAGGGGGKLVLIAIIVAAVVAAGLWFALR